MRGYTKLYKKKRSLVYYKGGDSLTVKEVKSYSKANKTVKTSKV